MYWIGVALLIAAAVLALEMVVAVFLYDIVFKRKLPKKKSPSEKKMLAEFDRFARLNEADAQWFLSHRLQEFSITAFDGISLHASYLPASGSQKTVFCAHGYRSRGGAYDFGGLLKYYHTHGYNVFVIDQRAHGRSGGKHICFGLKERFDIRDWMRFIEKKLHPAEVFLHGISMGATSVLMALGESLPACVKGIIADCGYTGLRSILTYVLGKLAHLPVRILLPVLEDLAKAGAKFGMDDCITTEILKKNKLPVLFIHGGQDNFVPGEMTRANYEACTAPKELLVVEEATHAASYMVGRKSYEDTLQKFIRCCEENTALYREA